MPALGDFDGDHRTDLAVGSGVELTVRRGGGDGTFGPPVTYPTGVIPWWVTAADFSGDGRFDLAVANGGDGSVSVLLGVGDGTFRPAVNY
jgi:hypothetical protein